MAEWMDRYYERCRNCAHPMTAHTDSLDTIPYSVCARFVLKDANTENEHYDACDCRLLAGVNDGRI